MKRNVIYNKAYWILLYFIAVFIIDSGNNRVSASIEIPGLAGLMLLHCSLFITIKKKSIQYCSLAQHWYTTVPECSAAPAPLRLANATTSLQHSEAQKTNMNFLSHPQDTMLHYLWWLCSWNCQWNLSDSIESKKQLSRPWQKTKQWFRVIIYEGGGGFGNTVHAAADFSFTFTLNFLLAQMSIWIQQMHWQ